MPKVQKHNLQATGTLTSKNLGSLLKVAIMLRGTTLTDITARADIKYQNISNYYMGKTLPRFDTLVQLVKALNASVTVNPDDTFTLTLL